MNVNEVVANHANLAAGAALGSQAPVHPNDPDGLSLRAAAMASGVVGAEEFGRLVDPRSMTHPTAGS